MENQHRQIRGYRELTEEEISLMNEIKQKGHEFSAILDKLSDHIQDQRIAASVLPGEAGSIECQRLDGAEPERWVSIGKTHLQTGLMALTRAVAQPGFF